MSKRQTLRDQLNGVTGQVYGWDGDNTAQVKELEARITELESIALSASKALLPDTDHPGEFRLGRVRMTRIGVELPDDLTQDEWGDIGLVLGHLSTSIGWLVGDWARYAHHVWGFPYEDISEWFDLELETIYVYGSVCDAYPILIRNQGVYMAHHRLVMGRAEPERSAILQEAAENRWTLKQMRAELEKRKGKPTPLLLDSPMLAQGKRLFLKKDEQKLTEMVKILASLKDGIREADEDTRRRIQDMAEEVRRFLDTVEKWAG